MELKNTIFFDSNFNFTLLENEENPENSIYIKFHTSLAGNQVLNILANGQAITESLASDDDIEYELEQTNWTNNGATVVWLTNDDVTSPKVKIIFSEIPTVSCAINRGTNTVFLMQYEGQNEDESGSGTGGSGSGGGFDFVETIRNIGFRLLDEPGNVSIEYDEINNSVSIKWTDPADIVTNEPAPAEWAGTVVVKKSGSAPLHKWDGTIIADSTTRDEYSVNALIDNNIDTSATYYYGIFPYDTKGDYRYTKVVQAFISEIPDPQINSLEAAATSISVNYTIPAGYTWDYITLVYKKNSAPADKTDGTAVSLSASDTSANIIGLDENTLYYFKIFAQVTGQSEELESNTASATTGEYVIITHNIIDELKQLDLSDITIFYNTGEVDNPYINTRSDIIAALQQHKIVLVSMESVANYSIDITDDVLSFEVPEVSGIRQMRILLPLDRIENVTRISEYIKYETTLRSDKNFMYVAWNYFNNGSFESSGFFAGNESGSGIDWTQKDGIPSEDKVEYLSMTLLHQTNASSAAVKLKDLFVYERQI